MAPGVPTSRTCQPMTEGPDMPTKEERAVEACQEAEKLNNAGMALTRAGDFPRAIDTFRDGLSRLRGLPPSPAVKQAEAALSGNVAQPLMRLGQLQEAAVLLGRQGALAEEIGNAQSYS